ncbi:tumor necrosis factor receptor superfamily member 10A-like [Saccopteryx leptura]|uniref:tumor necrosis factor receptor superfamily member 10A-like n=1 Tax=Saccopteryx leptura TaxID=249018 RepID=UPI00339BE036
MNHPTADNSFPCRCLVQPGPSALAASHARVRRSRALSSHPGAGPRLWGPNTLLFVLFVVLLSVSAASPTAREPDRVHQQPAALQRQNADLLEQCSPGFYQSELSGDCTPCIDGKDFTSHPNTLSSCQPCSKCRSDKEEVAPCNRTQDAECRCKPGTFQDEESPEFCQKCSPDCPDGKVEARTCTPWNDRVCVDQESGSPWKRNRIAAIAAVVGLLVLLVPCICCCIYRSPTIQGSGADPGNKNRVPFCSSCVPRGPEAMDNARNLIMSDGDSSSTLASEQELERQEHAEVAGVMVPSPGEAEQLLGAADTVGSQMRRGRLVPANDGDPIKTLKQFFDYFPVVVPFNSWRPLMRLMGLKANDIEVARARTTLNPGEALYEMLMIWLNNTGQAASVNILLDALEKLGERNAKEEIQDHLVRSGEYVYEEGKDS